MQEKLNDWAKANGVERMAERLYVEGSDEYGWMVTTCDFEAFTVIGMHLDTRGCENRSGYWAVSCTIGDTEFDLGLLVRIREQDGQTEESFTDLVNRLR